MNIKLTETKAVGKEQLLGNLEIGTWFINKSRDIGKKIIHDTDECGYIYCFVISGDNDCIFRLHESMVVRLLDINSIEINYTIK